jgi:hypothetical protein
VRPEGWGCGGRVCLTVAVLLSACRPGADELAPAEAEAPVAPGGEAERIADWTRVRPDQPRLGRILASGSWTVVARAEESTVLVRGPYGGSVRGAERGPPPLRASRPAAPTAAAPTPEVLIHGPDARLRRADVDVIALTLPDIPTAQARTLSLGGVRVGDREIYFGIPTAGPLLLPSPTDPEFYAFEAANSLWGLRRPGVVQRLSAERVGEFDYHVLSARQREGQVILYWAAAPVWSLDGRFIAYVSNREAVEEGESSQGVWLLEVETGRERPLLRERGRWFRPFGWLGRELLYTGSDPGVWAIDPATATRRHLATAAELDVADDGSALAVAEGVPEATVIRILSDGRWTTLPPAPRGHLYSAQAAFSPGGRRLLIQSTASEGEVRRFWVFDRQTGDTRPLEVPDHLLDGWPTWLDGETLLANSADPATGELYAVVLRAP